MIGLFNGFCRLFFDVSCTEKKCSLKVRVHSAYSSFVSVIFFSLETSKVSFSQLCHRVRSTPNIKSNPLNSSDDIDLDGLSHPFFFSLSVSPSLSIFLNYFAAFMEGMSVDVEQYVTSSSNRGPTRISGSHKEFKSGSKEWKPIADSLVDDVIDGYKCVLLSFFVSFFVYLKIEP